MIKIKHILSITLISLTSCDAALTLNYVVINKTSNNIKLKVIDFPKEQSRFSEVIDTIINVKPNDLLIIKIEGDLGFPWETKKIFDKTPNSDNFNLLINDSIITIDKSAKNWKYENRKSVFEITENHMLQH